MSRLKIHSAQVEAGIASLLPVMGSLHQRGADLLYAQCGCGQRERPLVTIRLGAVCNWLKAQGAEVVGRHRGASGTELLYRLVLCGVDIEWLEPAR
ncbi:hypothetical protein [Chitinimonas sp.]|uniref:hypothetical protein n=1 Tax=Chitinimonas sp. TaxID=1934313 RepID=UPI0035ADC61E